MGALNTRTVNAAPPGGHARAHRPSHANAHVDVFGLQRKPREWKSLEELGVLDSNSHEIASHLDPKPTFISGLIVRQLVREQVIPAE